MPTPIYLWLQEIQQSPAVRAKEREFADRIAARLLSIATRDHLSKETSVVTVREGTRPRGRSFAEVDLSDRTRVQADAEVMQALNGVSVATQAVAGSRDGA